jgi:hypothetical protein
MFETRSRTWTPGGLHQPPGYPHPYGRTPAPHVPRFPHHPFTISAPSIQTSRTFSAGQSHPGTRVAAASVMGRRSGGNGMSQPRDGIAAASIVPCRTIPFRYSHLRVRGVAPSVPGTRRSGTGSCTCPPLRTHPPSGALHPGERVPAPVVRVVAPCCSLTRTLPSLRSHPAITSVAPCQQPGRTQPSGHPHPAISLVAPTVRVAAPCHQGTRTHRAGGRTLRHDGRTRRAFTRTHGDPCLQVTFTVLAPSVSRSRTFSIVQLHPR